MNVSYDFFHKKIKFEFKSDEITTPGTCFEYFSLKNSLYLHVIYSQKKIENFQKGLIDKFEECLLYRKIDDYIFTALFILNKNPKENVWNTISSSFRKNDEKEKNKIYQLYQRISSWPLELKNDISFYRKFISHLDSHKKNNESFVILKEKLEKLNPNCFLSLYIKLALSVKFKNRSWSKSIVENIINYNNKRDLFCPINREDQKEIWSSFAEKYNPELSKILDPVFYNLFLRKTFKFYSLDGVTKESYKEWPLNEIREFYKEFKYQKSLWSQWFELLYNRVSSKEFAMLRDKIFTTDFIAEMPLSSLFYVDYAFPEEKVHDVIALRMKNLYKNQNPFYRYLFFSLGKYSQLKNSYEKIQSDLPNWEKEEKEYFQNLITQRETAIWAIFESLKKGYFDRGLLWFLIMLN